MGSGPTRAPHLLCSHLGIGTTTYVLLLEAEANIKSSSLFWGTAHPSSPGELPDVLLADVHTTRGGGDEQGQHQEEEREAGFKKPMERALLFQSSLEHPPHGEMPTAASQQPCWLPCSTRPSPVPAASCPNQAATEQS